MDYVLGAAPIVGEHSGDNIARVLREQLVRNKLELKQVICMVRDDGSNMKKSSNILKLDRYKIIGLEIIIIFKVYIVERTFYILLSLTH